MGSSIAPNVVNFFSKNIKPFQAGDSSKEASNFTPAKDTLLSKLDESMRTNGPGGVKKAAPTGGLTIKNMSKGEQASFLALLVNEVGSTLSDTSAVVKNATNVAATVGSRITQHALGGASFGGGTSVGGVLSASGQFPNTYRSYGSLEEAAKGVAAKKKTSPTVVMNLFNKIMANLNNPDEMKKAYERVNYNVSFNSGIKPKPGDVAFGGNVAYTQGDSLRTWPKVKNQLKKAPMVFVGPGQKVANTEQKPAATAAKPADIGASLLAQLNPKSTGFTPVNALDNIDQGLVAID